MTRGWNYQISGLQVHSEMLLRGSIACEEHAAVEDIRIRLDTVPASLDGVVAAGPNWQFAPPSFLMEIPGAVRFLVNSGTEIVVEPVSGTPVEDVAAFISGTGLAVALYQRGALILHASAVSRRGRAFAFCGASGAGKSTLAALLCLRGGCTMISDDVTVVDFRGAGPTPRADARELRLWEDMVELLDLGAKRRGNVRSMLSKYHIEAPVARADTLAPLAGIYLLETLVEGCDAEIAPVPLAEAAALLDSNLYRRALSLRLAARPVCFAQLARLLARVPVYRLRRPIGGQENDRVIARLQAHWDAIK
jgi:hypothetical protein